MATTNDPEPGLGGPTLGPDLAPLVQGIAAIRPQDLLAVGSILEDVANRYLDLAEICSAIHAQHQKKEGVQASEVAP